MVIQTNVSGLSAWRAFRSIGGKSARNAEKLSSGYRINRAADDAAGLAISEKMRSQIRGLNQAERNTQDGISLLQTAEGGMAEIGGIVQRIRELVVYAANDTNTMKDREKIQDEIDQLVSEIGDIAEKTEFNTRKLLTGTGSPPVLSETPGTEVPAQTYPITAEAAQIVRDAWTALTPAEKSAYLGPEGPNDRNGMIFKIKEFVDGVLAPDYRFDRGAISPETLFNINFHLGSGSTNTVFFLDRFFAERFCSTPDFRSFHITDIHIAQQIEDETRAAFLALDPNDPVRQNGENLRLWLTDRTNSYEGDFSYTIIMDNYSGWNAAKVYSYMMDGVGMTIDPNETYSTIWHQVNITGHVWKDVPDPPVAGGTTPARKSEECQGLWIQTGANSGQGLELVIGAMTPNALGLIGTDGKPLIDVRKEKGGTLTEETVGDGNTSDADTDDDALPLSASDAETVAAFLPVCDRALEYVNRERAKIGAMQNRLESAVNNLASSAENLSAAESRVRDADMAKRMMGFTKTNVLQQAALSMLAQANQGSEAVLRLLQG